MDRYEFIAAVHRLCRPRSYLEIGVEGGFSLALSRARSIGVDPDFRITAEVECPLKLVKLTSDEFFARPDALSWFPEGVVDLAFIDGLHLFEFGLRDFLNIEKHSAPASVVLMDDIFPRSAAEAARVRHTRDWTGDIYKLTAVLERYRPDLTVIPVNTSPTGILLVVDLDPGSTVLADGYGEIVAEYATAGPESVPYEVLHRVKAADPRRVLNAPLWARLAAARAAGEPPGAGRELKEIFTSI
jgi:hypothetical protein